MAQAMSPLGGITLSSAVSSISFLNIPQVYRDLLLVATCTSTTAGANGLLTVNNDSSASYARVYMLGNGSTTGSASGTGGTSISLADLETSLGTTSVHIMDYSETDKQKVMVCRNSVPSNFAFVTVGTWSSTSSITSVTFAASAGTFAVGNTFYLYGVIA